MIRKPLSVILDLLESKIYVPSVTLLRQAAPALFSRQDKSDADGLVADFDGKQYALESSLLEGFDVQQFRTAASKLAAVWMVEEEGGVVRPDALALVPSPRRSFLPVGKGDDPQRGGDAWLRFNGFLGFPHPRSQLR